MLWAERTMQCPTVQDLAKPYLVPQLTEAAECVYQNMSWYHDCTGCPCCFKIAYQLRRMGLLVAIWLILICMPSTIILSETNSQDVTALLTLKQMWKNVPPSWNRGNDSCGSQWEGIACRDSRIISITLSSMGLIGILPGDIQGLSELETLDLSYNKGLSGHLPPEIGNLAKLTTLILAGCNFNGELPDNIGSLSKLVFLSLNSNGFSGTIPQTIGKLSELYWLDLATNKLTGNIPISPGLDMLVHAKLFHFGGNQLSGAIPPQLFNENMNLLHLLLDNNQLSGTIPTTLSLVRTLEVIRFDWNSLIGSVPSSINTLIVLKTLLLSNNKLAGVMPDLTGMNFLSYLDMSNNSFQVSDVPSWVTALPSLTTLMIEQSQIQGIIPSAFFGLPQLQKVVLKSNKLSGMLDLGAAHSSQLQFVDLQNNSISDYTPRPADYNLQLILVGNPVCGTVLTEESQLCFLPQSSQSYSTPRNCGTVPCTSGSSSSPSCHCSYPYSVSALLALKQLWQNVPPSWNRVDDPCGAQWEGIACKASRVISIKLSSMGLIGTLSGDIQGLSELQTLDLSYNKGMSGHVPPEIGSLANLTTLILTGCSFNGEIPDTIGSLSKLVFLSLNSNKFTGTIPQTIGNLTQLYWLDLADNQFTGAIPISNGSALGLDNLVHTKHIHFGRNQLSGEIPPQLFNENMTMLHILLDNNQFTGTIPTTLGLAKTLEVVRFDWNSLSGSVPSSINSLNILTDMLLSNNQLTGPIPDLTGMNLLTYLDMSNNSYDVSDIPAWVTALPSLTTLMMERSQIQGTVPTALFSLPQLQQVVLKNNGVSGILDLGTTRSSQLQLVDLQNNNISAYTSRPADDSLELELILIGNPVCGDEVTLLQSRCILPISNPSYTTPRYCEPTVCTTSDEASSPNCKCAYPYSGILTFRATQFSNLHNLTYYADLEKELMITFQSNKVPVDSVSLSNITRDASNYLDIALQIFPLGQDRFNRTDILTIGFVMSNQTFKPPSYYGPFTFLANDYTTFSDEGDSGSTTKPKKKSHLGAIFGSIGSSLVAAAIAIWQRKNICHMLQVTFNCNCCNQGSEEGTQHDKY